MPDEPDARPPYTVKTVSVSYERKINLGNYNSAHLGVGLWAEPDEGADPEEVVRLLQEQARRLCREEYRRLERPEARPNGRVRE